MGKKKEACELKVVHDFYDVKEAAAYIKVTKGTLYQMIYKKETTKIPVKYNGSKPIFIIDELKKWAFERVMLS